MIKPDIIRKNWLIDLQFSVEKIDRDIITEKIIFEFDLINITHHPIKHTFKILQLTEDTNLLYIVSKIEENNQILIFSSKDFLTDYKFDGIMRRSKTIELEKAVLSYLYTHYISSMNPFIHNAFATRELTSALTIKYIVPKGYTFHVSSLEALKSQGFKEIDDYRVFYYKISEILIPGQIIEYTLRKGDMDDKI